MCQSLIYSSEDDKCINKSFLHVTTAKIKVFTRYQGETEEVFKGGKGLVKTSLRRLYKRGYK